MPKAGHAKLGRDKLLGRWGNQAPGHRTKCSHRGSRSRRHGRRLLTIPYAYRRALEGPRLRQGGLTLPRSAAPRAPCHGLSRLSIHLSNSTFL